VTSPRICQHLYPFGHAATCTQMRGQAPDRPCCRFFGIGHTIYKGVYLPSKEEYVAHGYPADRYEHAMAQWKRSVDATGRP
jgi:hypothetical protein